MIRSWVSNRGIVFVSSKMKMFWKKNKFRVNENIIRSLKSNSYTLNDLGLNAVFNIFFSHVTQASSPTLVFPRFLTPVLHTTYFPSNRLLFLIDLALLVKDKWRLSRWLLSNIEKNLGWAEIQIHNPWIAASLQTELLLQKFEIKFIDNFWLRIYI